MSRLIVSLLVAMLSTMAPAQDPRTDSLWKVHHQSAAEKDQLRTLAKIAQALRQADPDSSAAVADMLIARARTARDTGMIAEGMRHLGLARFIAGESDECLRLLGSALTLFLQGSDQESLIGAGMTSSNLGYVRKMRGELDAALEHCRTSIRHYDAVGHREHLAHAYNDIGQIHYMQGRPDSAILYYERMLNVSMDLGADRTASWACNNMSMVYSNIGSITRAIELAYRSLAILERLGNDSETATGLIMISDLKALLGETEGAMEVMWSAHRLYQQANDLVGVARTGSGIGGLLMDLGELDSAAIMLEAALSLEREHDLRNEMGHTMPNLGKVYRLKGRLTEARAILDEILAMAREIGNVPDEVWILTELGQLEIALERPDKALTHCFHALELSEAINALPAQQGSCECIYLAYKRQGIGMKALEYYERAMDIRGRVFDETAKRRITQQDMVFSFEKQQLADSLRHAGEMVQLESERTIERLRADRNADRALATGLGAFLMLGGGAGSYMLDRRRRRERYEKEAATLETQALRSQMNPHFIFNALNSINAFVQRNDQDRASSFLSKFARVMRMVLENSRQATVPLKDDLDALKGYMDLERMRMDHKFDHHIELDPTLDAEDVLVPPLVVQPFVENAIWHGMSGIESNGRIVLKVSRRQDQLVWTIEDNGGGRQAKKELDAGPGSIKKTSLGTTITRARLDLVKKQYGGEAGFEYVDIPQGTRVEVRMPLMTSS